MTIFPCEAGKPPLLSVPMPDRHMMVDIETLDTEITAVILSIAAVVFDPRGIEPETSQFSMTIEHTKQGERTTSQSTIDWWKQQDPIAYETAFGGTTPLNMVLSEFAWWINRLQPTCTRIWAKSPDFDCSILRHACVQQNIIWPFKFWENRCVRTIMELAYPMGDFPSIELDGPEHDALVDAKKQVIEVQHAYHVLGA